MVRTISAMALLAALSSSAAAAPHSITIINGTGAPLRDVAAKTENGSKWDSLTPGLSPGAKTVVSVDPDICAYEVKATAAGATLTWRGVNLCETSSVTLNRRTDGTLWVDYD